MAALVERVGVHEVATLGLSHEEAEPTTHPMTFDTTIHISEIVILLTAVWGLFKTGIGLRDSVRDLTAAVQRLTN